MDGILENLAQILYGPNVIIAVLGGVGVIVMFLALFAAVPSVDLSKQIEGPEIKRRSPLVSDLKK